MATVGVGPDEYWLLVDEELIAYGMLRGWAEGYAVPSLGIAVDQRYRGRGFAAELMRHLHSRVRERGAHQVRLKVDRGNRIALHPYQKLCYRFQDYSSTELVGYLRITD